MNLGAFAIVAFLRNAIGSEEIADYAGLIRTAPAHGRRPHGDPGQPDRHPAAGRLHRQVRDLPVARRRRRPVDDRPAGDRRHQHGHLADLLPARGEGRVHRSRRPPTAAPSPSACCRPSYVLVVALPVLIYGIIPARILEIARARHPTIVDVESPRLPLSLSPRLPRPCPPTDTIDVLNRVLAILERSFPQYLRYARPYIPPGRENVMQTIDAIVAGQDCLAERVSQHSLRIRRPARPRRFPDRVHRHARPGDRLPRPGSDRLPEAGHRRLGAVRRRAAARPGAQSLASEALGLTKGHLELLKNIPLDPAASTLRGPEPALDNN